MSIARDDDGTSPAAEPSRQILHADMDAFYASIEQRDKPELAGRPIVVGGKPPRGVVAAASYEARRYGVRSAMPTVRALEACRDLVLLEPRMSRYVEVSSAVFEIFRRASPLVEGLSLDEAFIDVSGRGDAEAIAHALRRDVSRELSLTVSVGVAPNKMLAKIASDVNKPDGLFVIAPSDVAAFLENLPVGRIFGVGRVTEQRLADIGVRTAGELSRLPRELLVRRFGVHGAQLWSLSRGDDRREVNPERERESIGAEQTFERDIVDVGELAGHVEQQAQRVAARLRDKGYRARVVVLKIKTAEHAIHTRRRTLPQATDEAARVSQVARELLAEIGTRFGPLRLTGVSAAGLVGRGDAEQLALPFDSDR
ncbi:MAG: DNA polymerase IV [Myxococcales bacterium]|nr:DNA polymerase IV [Myxococcales bacterium]